MKSFNTNIVIGGQLSPSLQKAFDAVNKFTRKSSAAFKTANSDVNKFNKALQNTAREAKYMGGAIATAGAAGTVALAAKGTSAMLSQASSMEQYRNTLNIVMKDTKKAGETFKWAVDYANKTPFETADIVDGTVKLQSYGLEAQKVLPVIGDMASAMGKGMDQAVEAVADAQTGELERLKEFGITKEQIVKQANKKLGDIEVVNSKGQITNQKAFNDALISLMEERFKGGMEVQANSFKGVMSTITGVWKSGLAEMAGINSEGLVIDGSFFDVVKDKAAESSKKLQELQKSGKFTELQKSFGKFATDVANGIDTALPKLMDFGSYVLNNGPQIMNTVKFIGVAFLSWKAISFVAGAVTTIASLANVLRLARTQYLPLLFAKMQDMALTAGIIGLYTWDAIVKGASAIKTFLLAGAQGALNLAMTIGTGVMAAFGAVMAFLTSPIGLVIMAIMALVAVGYVLWQNWDSISRFFVGIWQDYVLPFFASLTGWFSGLWEGITSTFNGFINGIISGINGLISMLNGISFSVPDWIPGVGGKKFGINIPKIPAFAKGGIATSTSICGEAGPEAVIPLKRNNPRSIQLLQQTSKILGVNQVRKEPLGTLKPRVSMKNKKIKTSESAGNIYNFQPVIYADSSNKEQIKNMITSAFEDFKDFIENINEDNERINIDESVFEI